MEKLNGQLSIHNLPSSVLFQFKVRCVEAGLVAE